MAESIGVVYGRALSQLSFEEGCEEQVYLQMQDLNEIFVQNEEFMNLLCAPVISTEEKSQLIDRVFGGQVLPVVLNFLKVLAESGRFAAFASNASGSGREKPSLPECGKGTGR